MSESPSSNRESNSRTGIDFELQSKLTKDVRRYLQQSASTTFRRPFAKNFKEKRRSIKQETASVDRGSWWRVHLRDTPNPGTYETHLNTFIKEVLSRPMTYGFKSDGRKRDPQPLEPKGKELLPGAYSYEDFGELTNRLPSSYPFKGPQREEVLQRAISAHRDKDIDVPPGSYETQVYQRIEAPIEFVSHSFFKSKTERNPVIRHFAPAPGEYDIQMTDIDYKRSIITSPFRSSTDRFYTRTRNVPGPGTYDNLTHFPSLRQINRYSARGVYFNDRTIINAIYRYIVASIQTNHERQQRQTNERRAWKGKK